MTISSGQAAEALGEIERTERRAHVAKGYSMASPHLILWGLVWIAGYGACALLAPERWGLAWLPLALAGALGSAWLGARSRTRRSGGNAVSSGQGVLIGLAVMVFMAATYYLFAPRSPLPYLVFPSLVAGLVYGLAGAVTRMPRFVWIGAGIFVLTMAGYAAAPAWSALWVAAAGGGGLLLGGFWLRKA
jgi:hypothetical protein